jgi:hypothetical protein
MTVFPCKIIVCTVSNNDSKVSIEKFKKIPVTINQPQVVNRLTAAGYLERNLNEMKKSEEGRAVTITALAEELGVARKTIYAWMKLQGCPGKNKDEKFEIKSWQEWILKNGLGERQRNAVLSKDDLIHQQAKNWALRNKALEESMLDLEETESLWLSKITAARSAMESMPTNLAPQLSGLEPDEIQAKLQAAIDSIIEAMSKA